ncbi:dehydrogenase reductase [Fusarium albosuccineum]|uniref:Dehydrogenase reductase n=1 Tax=Fusarium albosuccineum TaxID=1237068 RepID=A0A8H4L9Z0_9HYPO|nr:dehydrogenase reductase [Fusarium albosuccineum]
MTGTVIITGANGSLALGFVDHLLSTYPSYTLLATVRNPSQASDANTAKLAKIISSKNTSSAHIEALDLASLASVRSFAETTAKRIATGEIPPISALVCNAMTWSLSEQLYTPDGMERTFQVGHLSQYLLVLKLLGSMAKDGRVVLLGSTAHYTDRPNPLAKLIAEFPEDVNLLIKPTPDEPGQEHDRGFQRYGTTKLANVMLMHDLNEKLQKDPKLSNITATAMDPGGLVDSRANYKQKPGPRAIFTVVNWLIPVLKHLTTDVRRSADAGKDLVEVSVGPSFKDVRGYHIGIRRGDPTPSSQDVDKRKTLWKACWEWAGLEKHETALSGAAP